MPNFTPCNRTFCFFFNDTATTEIYTLSLHDALPIYREWRNPRRDVERGEHVPARDSRSEEHTSELQSRFGISYALFFFKKTKQRSARGESRSPRPSALRTCAHPRP